MSHGLLQRQKHADGTPSDMAIFRKRRGTHPQRITFVYLVHIAPD